MIHLHAWPSPPRAETWQGGIRIWSEATVPGETLADVTADLARRVIAWGAPPSTPARVWLRGSGQGEAATLAELAGRVG